LAGLPGLKQIWGFALAVPMICGAAVTLGAAGADLKKRIIGAALCGVSVGLFSTIISAGMNPGAAIGLADIVVNSIWRMFIFTILTVVGLLLTEVNLPDPTVNGQIGEVGSRKAEVGMTEGGKVRR
jgi:hypothetical protein